MRRTVAWLVHPKADDMFVIKLQIFIFFKLQSLSCIVMIKCIVAHRKQQILFDLMFQFYKKNVSLHAK